MRRAALRALVGERLVVHTRDGRSLRGVLTSAPRGWVVLADVEYLDKATSVGMPGEAWIADENRSWVHRIGENAPVLTRGEG